jgi:hypothetical protein
MTSAIFFMHSNPHLEEMMNTIEKVNEMSILIFNVHMFCYTELIKDS